MKVCSTCGEAKEADLFRKDRGQCLACRAAYRATNRRENASSIAAYNAKYRRERPEIYRENAEKYRKENPDKVKAQQANWYRKNAAKLRAYAAEWHRSHPEEARAREAENHRKHPERARAKKQARRARLRGAGGRFTAAQIQELAIMQGHKCANPGCRKSLKRSGKLDCHRDHMQPLALGGSNDIGNIQLLCGPCNLKKKAMPYEDWCKETSQLCLVLG